jgi:hypothetical protein
VAHSGVAVVFDRGGGYRVVIDQVDQFHFHVNEGEKLLVIPGLNVQEPISIAQFAGLTPLIEKTIDRYRKRL